MEITAAVLRKPSEPFVLETVKLDEPGVGEVLVRIVATGVCHTDIGVQHIMPVPVVLGHEGSGIVAAVGPGVTKVGAGDRVVLTFGSCGACPTCVAGAPSHCHNMRTLQFSGARQDGTPTMRRGEEVIHGAFFQQSSFATYALATERNIVRVEDEDVLLELLGPLGCGIQTGAGAVLNSLQVRAGSTIAVFGAGSVGLSAVMAARIAGCSKIIAVDVNRQRLELASDLGANEVIDAGAGDVANHIRESTVHGADYTLETAGAEQSFSDALACLTMGGTCGIVTVPNHGAPFEFSPREILTGGRKLIGVLEGSSVPDLFIPQLVDFFVQGEFPMDRLATYYPFEKINEAVADSVSGSTVKPILRMA